MSAHIEVATESIQEIDCLSIILDKLRMHGKRIILSHGVFDLLHPGHIRHLHSAKKQGDVLVVSITADAYVRKGPGRPIFNQVLRAETLSALEVVDYVCVVHEYNAIACIQKLRPHIYVKGFEYHEPSGDPTGEIVEEEKAVRAVGGEMFFTSDEVVFSSTKLINQYAGVLSETQSSFLQQIKNKYPSGKDAVTSIKQLGKLRVMIIGDTIIDEYVYCEPLGQSLKQPLVVHQYLKEERFCGGVVAVANQIADFCKDVQLVTVLGHQNSFDDYVRLNLRHNVNAQIFTRDDAPTVVKRRYVYSNVEQKVFEVCHIQDHDVPEQIEQDIVSYIARVAPDYDLVMVCDYGHGALTQRITQETRKATRFLAVNAQTNSVNMGYNFITQKYSGPDFACVDEAEARLALRDKHRNIKTLGPRLLQQLDTMRLIITHGRSGSTGFERSGEICAAPAFAMNVVDRVGAGDAFFGVTAPCFALGLPMDLVSFIGNAVGALAVQIVGNRETVLPRDLIRLISHLLV